MIRQMNKKNKENEDNYKYNIGKVIIYGQTFGVNAIQESLGIFKKFKETY